MFKKYLLEIFVEKNEIAEMKEYLRQKGCTKCTRDTDEEKRPFLKFIIPYFKKGPLIQMLNGKNLFGKKYSFRLLEITAWVNSLEQFFFYFDKLILSPPYEGGD